MAGDVALSQDDIDNLLSGGLEESSSESESTPQQSSSQAQEPSADSSGDVFQGLDNLLGGGESAPSPGGGAGPGAQATGSGGGAQQQSAKFGLENIDSFGNLSTLMNVIIDINVQLGKKSMMIKDILSLGEGSIIELDKSAGDPVDVMAKDRPLARGEVVVVDEQFGVRITEKVDPSTGI
jgi:flagellar motor switch protein FliN/FliY